MTKEVSGDSSERNPHRSALRKQRIITSKTYQAAVDQMLERDRLRGGARWVYSEQPPRPSQTKPIEKNETPEDGSPWR